MGNRYVLTSKLRTHLQMAKYSTEIATPMEQDDVFLYMADFRNAVEWDENTSSVKLAEGSPLEVGASYEVVTEFGGRDLNMTYRAVEIERPRRIVFESSTSVAGIRDTIEIQSDGGGSLVNYEAQILTSGLSKLLDPVFALVFKRVGDRAAESLRKALRAG